MKQWLVLVFCVLAFTKAHAYRLTEDFSNGFYWASLPVEFMVMDSDPDRLALIEGLALEAVGEWEESLVENLWSVSAQQGSPVANRNIIRWSTRFAAETGLSESSTLAVAIRYTGGPYVARAEIVLNGSHPLNSFPNQLRTVLVHELGHTLGLDHSDVGEAVMAPTLQINYEGLHWDDEQGMASTVLETKRRQAIGYVSPLSVRTEESSKSALSCGTVDIGGGDGPTGGGPGSPMLSLGLGLLFALAAFLPAFKSRAA